MKGSNLKINEAKQELTSAVNSSLKELPVGVVMLLLEGILTDVKNLYGNILVKEASEYEEEMKKEESKTEEED